jgi:two-component system sensor histidine kinase HydH
MNPWLSRAASTTLFAITYGLRQEAPLYALPIALAAHTDRWAGALVASVIASIAIFAAPGDLTHRLANSIALISLGQLIAWLFSREHRQRDKLQKTADQLSSVYERVQANFEGMKRIERLSAIGQLSAGFAHEIRNPLASISGAAAILSRNAQLEPKHAKCVEIIASECDRLNGLLTNFLDFARPRPPHLQTIHVDRVLDNVLALAGHGLRGKTVHFEKQVPPDLPMVDCDPEQLEQVLLNLMINAIEASANGETVTLSAMNRNGTVAILVIDAGEGVAPAHIDRLFDPFFTTKEHGTGLGLPVAHQIMTQMGGSLLAKRNPTQGMTFSILLPAKPA